MGSTTSQLVCVHDELKVSYSLTQQAIRQERLESQLRKELHKIRVANGAFHYTCWELDCNWCSKLRFQLPFPREVKEIIDGFLGLLDYNDWFSSFTPLGEWRVRPFTNHQMDCYWKAQFRIIFRLEESDNSLQLQNSYPLVPETLRWEGEEITLRFGEKEEWFNLKGKLLEPRPSKRAKYIDDEDDLY